MLRKFIVMAVVLTVFFSLVPIAYAANENMVPAGNAELKNLFSMENFGANGQMPQVVFGEGTPSIAQLKTKDGKTTLALKVTGLGKNTWSSPCVDIFSIIKKDVEKNGPGRYAVGFNLLLDGKEGEEYKLSVTVRASNKTELFSVGNGGEAGYRTSIGEVKALSGIWKNFSSTFGVKKEDVQGDESWKMCLDRIPETLTTIYIADLMIFRVSDDSSSTVQNTMCVDSSQYASMTATDTGKIEKGVNLLDEKTSTFSGVTDWQQTKWTGFSAGAMSISEEGYSGPSIKMETPKNTWGSPAIDIFPMITEPGEYTFSVFARYDGEGEKKLNIIMRGTKETTVIEQHGTNFYGQLCSKTLTAGQWSKMTATFKVTEEDLQGEDSWKVCYSSISADIEAVYFDEAVLIKGTSTDLPEAVTPDEGVVVEQKSEEKQLYDPNTKDAMVKTAIITAVIVIMVILFKTVLWPFIIKKGAGK